MENQDTFEKALRFLGYGDPDSANIWFVGIEEAKSYENLDQVRQLPAIPFETYQGCADAPTPVYQIISKSEHPPFRVYPQSNVILTPFFTSRFGLMGNDQIDELIGLIGKMNLNPFDSATDQR